MLNENYFEFFKINSDNIASFEHTRLYHYLSVNKEKTLIPYFEQKQVKQFEH